MLEQKTRPGEMIRHKCGGLSDVLSWLMQNAFIHRTQGGPEDQGHNNAQARLYVVGMSDVSVACNGYVVSRHLKGRLGKRVKSRR